MFLEVSLSLVVVFENGSRKSHQSFVLAAHLVSHGGCLNVHPHVLKCISSGDFSLFGADASNTTTLLSVATKDCYPHPRGWSFFSRSFWLLPHLSSLSGCGSSDSCTARITSCNSPAWILYWYSFDLSCASVKIWEKRGGFCMIWLF